MSELVVQMEGGREFRIIGTNRKDVLDRTLTATADGEQFNTTTAGGVDSEAWWEDGGTVHCSLLLGGGS